MACGTKYSRANDSIIAALECFGPMTPEEIKKKLSMRHLILSLDDVQRQLKTLIRFKRIKKSNDLDNTYQAL